LRLRVRVRVRVRLFVFRKYSGVNPCGMIANPEVTHFPGSHNIFMTLHSFFEWCNRINAVDNHQDYQLTLKAGYPLI
jgi:hypothetical protein